MGWTPLGEARGEFWSSDPSDPCGQGLSQEWQVLGQKLGEMTAAPVRLHPVSPVLGQQTAVNTVRQRLGARAHGSHGGSRESLFNTFKHIHAYLWQSKVIIERSHAAVDKQIAPCSDPEWAYEVALVIKNPPDNVGDIRDIGSIPGLGRSLGGEQGNPLQYSCLENSMDRSIVHEVAKSQTWLRD